MSARGVRVFGLASCRSPPCRLKAPAEDIEVAIVLNLFIVYYAICVLRAIFFQGAPSLARVSFALADRPLGRVGANGVHAVLGVCGVGLTRRYREQPTGPTCAWDRSCKYNHWPLS
ncbi:unnamed protein product [Peniophora sp. CBMAI 1063]|nr:unnamed protein product [Peniophora sp. CBMAI 1063]